MSDGASLFARYAYPPNELGYCGPAEQGWEHALDKAGFAAERVRVVRQFDGAWPYLELIGRFRGLDPLDARVVDAYWIGNSLIDDIDMLTWGNAIEERFRPRAGTRWSAMEPGILNGHPTHAYHVFCVYPWVGLLRSGHTDHALRVMDRCRIRWGTVEAIQTDHVVVSSRPLTWDGASLLLGEPIAESVQVHVETPGLGLGRTVSLHWDYVCEVIGPPRLARLAEETARHLAMVNTEQKRLAAVVEA